MTTATKDSTKFGKWLGAGIGWAFGGPIGGILGFALGTFFDKASVTTLSEAKDSPYSTKTQPGDFDASLLVLSAAVMKADGRTMKSELDHLKTFLVRNFGEEHAREQLLLFKEILKQDIPVHSVCQQIKQHMPLPHRLQLIHFLFGVSNADGEVHDKEIEIIYLISSYLAINEADFLSIKAMYVQDKFNDYKILEISPKASDDDVKKAYRKMAVKFHPDKVSNMGEDIQKAAKEKFQKVQEAYENIKKKRGFS